MLGGKDDESHGNGRRAYLRSVSWTDRSPNKPNPCYPRAQPSSKARSSLPPLQPLSILRRNVEEWPKAGSDDLGVWPQQPSTPGAGRTGGVCSVSGKSSVKSSECLKIEVPGRKFESNRDRLAFYEKECSRIVDHIYLGSEMVAKSREVLRQNGITHVLNCVGFVCPEYFKGDLGYKTLWLQDSPSEDITSILYDVFDYFEDVREQGGRVLVHCCQGVSRSTSLVIAYLMWKEGQNFEEAFEYVKAARGVTNPNMGFACQLLQCQKRVHAVPASPNSVLRMYRMAPHSPYDPLHLVPKMIGNPGQHGLDSRGAFVIHVPSTIYVWVGKFCSSVMSNNARLAAYQVVKYERAQGPILTLKEGQEPSEFWNALSGEENLKDESVNVDVGGRKVDDYNLDFEIFQKALSGGVVPPFTSPGSPDETRLPNREIGWGRLRRKLSDGIMKEFLSSPKVTENDPEHNLEEPVSPTAHLLQSLPTPLSESTIPESNEICEGFELFVRGGTDSSDFSKSPSLSPTTSDYSSPFTFSPSSSNWSDLSNLSSQPSPTGLELYDHLPKRNLDSVEIDSQLQKESSKSCLDSFNSPNGWKSSSLYSSSRGISPSIAERRGSSPPALMLRQTAEVVHVPRPLVKSWSFSLPDTNDETVRNIWGIEREHEDSTKASRDELMPDADY
ncbi:protein-tyrosine-phosphatase MKP1 [Silene latifolia]|uniref:protein-tyrosine-phosphatase MKP1 n=1 Tax=Silene latifolia TaxID=37657 RepID=UPI003D76E545